MRSFKIDRNPYLMTRESRNRSAFRHTEKEKPVNMFAKTKLDFETGVTVLVGCNGAGKTTLVNMMKDQLEKQGIEYMSFNNMIDGGGNAMQLALETNQIAMLATQATSSEGENILINIGHNAGKIGRKLHENPDLKELWLFFDAVDSGLSIDNIVDVKKHLFNLIVNDPSNYGKEIYIIVTANSFEMAKDYPCVSVQDCKHRTFKTYEGYRNFILRSKEMKEDRDRCD